MLDENRRKDIISTLENIDLSLELILERFGSIHSSDDFFDTNFHIITLI